jgi:hypothetical protein
MKIRQNERGFSYIELCSGSHGHEKTRIWINRALVPEGDEIEFPIQGAQVETTEKGTHVMRPATGTIYLVEIPSGYRGSARITEVEGGEIVARGQRYHSGQGATGETAWAVVNAQGRIKVTGRKTGRRVDKNDVGYYLYPDGRKEDAVNDELENLL